MAQVREKAGALHVLMNIVGSNALVMLPEACAGAARPPTPAG